MALAAIPFVLSWFLKEVPLKTRQDRSDELGAEQAFAGGSRPAGDQALAAGAGAGAALLALALADCVGGGAARPHGRLAQEVEPKRRAEHQRDDRGEPGQLGEPGDRVVRQLRRGAERDRPAERDVEVAVAFASPSSWAAVSSAWATTAARTASSRQSTRPVVSVSAFRSRTTKTAMTARITWIRPAVPARHALHRVVVPLGRDVTELGRVLAGRAVERQEGLREILVRDLWSAFSTFAVAASSRRRAFSRSSSARAESRPASSTSASASCSPPSLLVSAETKVRDGM